MHACTARADRTEACSPHLRMLGCLQPRMGRAYDGGVSTSLRLDNVCHVLSLDTAWPRQSACGPAGTIRTPSRPAKTSTQAARPNGSRLSDASYTWHKCGGLCFDEAGRARGHGGGPLGSTPEFSASACLIRHQIYRNYALMQLNSAQGMRVHVTQCVACARQGLRTAMRNWLPSVGRTIAAHARNQQAEGYSLELKPTALPGAAQERGGSHWRRNVRDWAAPYTTVPDNSQ